MYRVWIRAGILMNERQAKLLTGVMTLLLFGAMLMIAKKSAELDTAILTGFMDNKGSLWSVLTGDKGKKECTVVLDAGHGGIDPGKVGVNGSLEKDVNLAIVLKLEALLKNQGIEVVLTRKDDKGLYNESDSNKKVRDMKNRLAIIEQAKPVIAVSIHQNSYPTEEVSGAQVFYYKNSAKSREAAEIMQRQMIKTLKPQKEREPKANDSYYLLKKTSVPILIVECGFMSNKREAELLVDENYQQQVAWSVYMGIMQYISSEKNMDNTI